MTVVASAFGYNPVVAAHFEAPLNTPCHEAGPDVVFGSAGDVGEGVAFRLSARVEAERLVDARFEAYGCPYAIAAASRLTEQLRGMTEAEAEAWNWRALARELEVPHEKRGRLLILEDALRDLLAAWQARSDQRTDT